MIRSAQRIGSSQLFSSTQYRRAPSSQSRHRSWLKGVFVWSLEHALKATGKAAHGLPYEFRALESCLISVVTALETDLANVRSHVVELLAHMEEHIDRENLRLLLHYSRKLSVFQKRATLVQECLDELLANGESC